MFALRQTSQVGAESLAHRPSLPRTCRDGLENGFSEVFLATGPIVGNLYGFSRFPLVQE